MIWRWPNFTPNEMACRGQARNMCDCDGGEMIPAFMDRLQQIRDQFNKPMIITSGFRCPLYNAQVSHTGLDGPHTTGRAVDVSVYGADYHELLKIALDFGITGIGSNQKGNYPSRFLHIDDLWATPKRRRPWGWTY